MERQTILSVKDLSKSFGHFHALDHVSFDVPEGSVFGVIGPNGAGKSTLLKQITSLSTPTSGSITIRGIDVQANPGAALAKTGSIVEWPNFYRDLTARQNIHILSRGQGNDYLKKFAEIAEFTGMTEWLDHKVRDFSTGMRQRLAITLALLPDSQFIILDEPTNGLDPAGIIDIRNLIHNYNHTFKTTILVTTHLLEEVERICSDLMILSHGKIAASGTLQELVAREPVICLTCDRPEAAKSFLESGDLPIENITLQDRESLVIRMSVMQPERVNAALVGAGFSVFSLGSEPNRLEKVFLQVTGGKK